MSSIRLLKDDARGKKGEVVSVPFAVGKEMLARGVGEYPRPAAPAEPKAMPVSESAAARHEADIKRLNALHASDVQAVRDECREAMRKDEARHQEEVAALQGDLDAARKTITELQGKIGGGKK